MRVNLSPVDVAEEQIKEQGSSASRASFRISMLLTIAILHLSMPDRSFTSRGSRRPIRSCSLEWDFLQGWSRRAMTFPELGQGFQGYIKCYEAGYVDVSVGTFIGSAVLPSLLKQDPRYFYRGTGSTRSRIGYGLANGVMCKGDNKHWQPNYSVIAGAFATGGISYLYYPASDRGVGLLVQNSLLRVAESSIAGIFQESYSQIHNTRTAPARS